MAADLRGQRARRFGWRILFTEDGMPYQPGAFYCKDAFEGLATMDALINPQKRPVLLERLQQDAAREMNRVIEKPPSADGQRSAVATALAIPRPPAWGASVVRLMPLEFVFQHLFKDELYRLSWGAKNTHGEEWELLKAEFDAVFLENPEAGARNFVYVSVISPEIQNMVKAGTYLNEVYNYDPKIAETLLGMAVGENISVSDLDTGFTYERKADTQLSGYNAQAYENLQPWEFPVGTKEIRYYVSLDACMYQIGGYVDTTESDQPGSISEVLFNEIVATIQFVP